MDGAFTTTTEDIYRSDDGKITAILTTYTDSDQPELRVRIDDRLFILRISAFDELVSAVEVLQDRARARRSGLR